MSKACTASPDQRELRNEIGGRIRAVRLVVGIEIGAERLLGFIEDDGQMRRPLLRLHVAQQLPQHVAEAEHGIDLQPVRLAVERRQRVIGAEDVARAIDQEDVVALFQRADGGGVRRLFRNWIGGGFRGRFGGFRCWHGAECGPSGATMATEAVDICPDIRHVLHAELQRGTGKIARCEPSIPPSPSMTRCRR